MYWYWLVDWIIGICQEWKFRIGLSDSFLRTTLRTNWKNRKRNRNWFTNV